MCLAYIDTILSESIDDVVRDEKRLILYATEAIHGETARQAGDTTEEGLESFCEMMRNEVL